MERTDDRSGRRVRAIRVYTLCQESRYLIVRNVPALGCIDELVKLFALYGPIEEYRLMDEEDCEEFTDVYWIKFAHISNARFAKRKLDEYQFLGNLLQVSYAPNHETLADTRNKLEERQRTVLNRLKCNSRSEQQQQWQPQGPRDPLLSASWHDNRSAEQPPPSPLEQLHPAVQGRGVVEIKTATAISSYPQNATIQMNPHEQFRSPSMDATRQAVRQKLNKISSVSMQTPELSGRKHGGETNSSTVSSLVGNMHGTEPAMKKQRQDNRRRI
ncbi:hypothetical protein CY35_08G053900 [Sphagnum magellanicum]|nr:hypothetical protein CY35_08G053900 [Sphagnum magellanicum]